MAARWGVFAGSLTLLPILFAWCQHLRYRKAEEERENRSFLTYLTAATLPPLPLPKYSVPTVLPSVHRLRVGRWGLTSQQRHWGSGSPLRLSLCSSCRTQVGSLKQQSSPQQSQQNCPPQLHLFGHLQDPSHTAWAVGAPGGGGRWSLPVAHLPGLPSMLSHSFFLHCSMNTKHGSQQISKNAVPSCDFP